MEGREKRGIITTDCFWFEKDSRCEVPGIYVSRDRFLAAGTKTRVRSWFSLSSCRITNTYLVSASRPRGKVNGIRSLSYHWLQSLPGEKLSWVLRYKHDPDDGGSNVSETNQTCESNSGG